MIRAALAASLALMTLPAAAQGTAFRPVVEAALRDVILPAHAGFVRAAGEGRAAMEALCAAPSPDALAPARAAFVATVGAFGRVEPYRIGPAVEDNRFDRILFWPDRRSRGQRQMEQLIAQGGEPDPVALKGKSVAVQGLPALELVLHGSGAGALATPDGATLCRYGAAVATAIETTAQALEAGWRGPFGAAVLGAGDDPASPYLSHGEVVKDLLGAAAELLHTDAALKLGPNVVGATPGEGNPRLAPFWRSGATATLLIGNAESLSAFATPALATALAGEAGLVDQTRFELAQAVRALAPLAGVPLTEAAADAAAHRRLVYATSVLGAARKLYAERIPAVFGFAAGFNALDGD